MRKECGDPGAVNEVAGASEGGSEEQVEENAVVMINTGPAEKSKGGDRVMLTLAGRKCWCQLRQR